MATFRFRHFYLSVCTRHFASPFPYSFPVFIGLVRGRDSNSIPRYEISSSSFIMMTIRTITNILPLAGSEGAFFAHFIYVILVPCAPALAHHPLTLHGSRGTSGIRRVCYRRCRPPPRREPRLANPAEPRSPLRVGTPGAMRLHPQSDRPSDWRM